MGCHGLVSCGDNRFQFNNSDFYTIIGVAILLSNERNGERTRGKMKWISLPK